MSIRRRASFILPNKVANNDIFDGFLSRILQAVGFPLILNAYYSLGISAVLVFLVLVFLFLYRLKLEEEVLIREVKGYRDYMKRTYRLIPKIW